MITIILAKRHSLEDAQTVIAKFKKYSFDDFHQLFREGRAPSFDEIEGDTFGSFLALNPKAGWWRKIILWHAGQVRDSLLPLPKRTRVKESICFGIAFSLDGSV
jgi:hypothetical protein